MENIVRLIEIFQVTHDVKCFRTEKPPGYEFLPGHATDLSINKRGLEKETRPFTFTALRSEPYLEFTIKRYADRHGITDKLHHLKPGDELIVRDSWGAIDYKGPGYFFAGGAGITPFIAILRSLYHENKIEHNKLFFSNKTEADIIYKDELTKMLGRNIVFILTRDKIKGFENGRIDEKFIRKNISDYTRHFYICGPDPMVIELVATLQRTGASTEALVFEK
ncbi:MAG TPA: FAD-binding oxidoreductase [Puia sp.]|jgi:ferredoxin-NADP reductase|nr:FAD-binding oxidoreductase [Puia sp.]